MEPSVQDFSRNYAGGKGLKNELKDSEGNGLIHILAKAVWRILKTLWITLLIIRPCQTVT
ncbi:MAG TPA: hypothetical protein DCG19_06555 [Cryomorphaceae bacterium]|nr:hypothetical protein [Owenweeksia sp.]HAD97049.1 hypothetical protein [Cryomorphaceae bacterium]